MMALNVLDISGLLKNKGGFLVKLNEGDVFAIPAGFMVWQFVADEASSVRWGVYAASDKAVVHETVKMQLQTYSFLADTDYKVFHDVLEAQ